MNFRGLGAQRFGGMIPLGYESQNLKLNRNLNAKFHINLSCGIDDLILKKFSWSCFSFLRGEAFTMELNDTMLSASQLEQNGSR